MFTGSRSPLLSILTLVPALLVGCAGDAAEDGAAAESDIGAAQRLVVGQTAHFVNSTVELSGFAPKKVDTGDEVDRVYVLDVKVCAVTGPLALHWNDWNLVTAKGAADGSQLVGADAPGRPKFPVTAKLAKGECASGTVWLGPSYAETGGPRIGAFHYRDEAGHDAVFKIEPEVQTPPLGRDARFIHTDLVVRNIERHSSFVGLDIWICANGEALETGRSDWSLEDRAGGESPPVDPPVQWTGGAVLPANVRIEAGKCLNAVVPFRVDDPASVRAFSFSDPNGGSAEWTGATTSGK